MKGKLTDDGKCLACEVTRRGVDPSKLIHKVKHVCMETEVMEQNKLISEFVGPSQDWNDSRLGKIKLYCHTDPNNPNCEARELKYHKDWNALMYVVEKIEADPLNDVCIFKEATQIRVWSGDEETFKWKVLEPDGSSKIAHVYRAVVKYIEYSNTPHP